MTTSLARLWRNRDIDQALAADRAAIQLGDLNRNHALRMARRQVGVGRFAQALSLLLDSRFVRPATANTNHAGPAPLPASAACPRRRSSAQAMELNEAQRGHRHICRTVRSLAELGSDPNSTD